MGYYQHFGGTLERTIDKAQPKDFKRDLSYGASSRSTCASVSRDSLVPSKAPPAFGPSLSSLPRTEQMDSMRIPCGKLVALHHPVPHRALRAVQSARNAPQDVRLSVLPQSSKK